MDVNEFKVQFNHIRDMGYIKSHRKGSTGVGKTLEDLLSLQENNIASPDLGKIELKAHRMNSQSLITLFTFNRKVWQIPPLEAIRKYGSEDENGRLGMYYTMSLKPNSAGLFLHITNESIAVQHIDGTVIAVWSLATISERFIQKFPALILVTALVELRDGIEYFHYQRAQLLKGTNSFVLYHLFQSEKLRLDLRLHDKGTSARNHGTGFRVAERHLSELFSEIADIG